MRYLLVLMVLVATASLVQAQFGRRRCPPTYYGPPVVTTDGYYQPRYEVPRYEIPRYEPPVREVATYETYQFLFPGGDARFIPLETVRLQDYQAVPLPATLMATSPATAMPIGSPPPAISQAPLQQQPGILPADVALPHIAPTGQGYVPTYRSRHR